MFKPNPKLCAWCCSPQPSFLTIGKASSETGAFFWTSLPLLGQPIFCIFQIHWRAGPSHCPCSLLIDSSVLLCALPILPGLSNQCFFSSLVRARLLHIITALATFPSHPQQFLLCSENHVSSQNSCRDPDSHGDRIQSHEMGIVVIKLDKSGPRE